MVNMVKKKQISYYIYSYIFPCQFPSKQKLISILTKWILNSQNLITAPYSGAAGAGGASCLQLVAGG